MNVVIADSFSQRRKFPRRALRGVVGILAKGVYFVADAGELGEGGMSFSSDMLLDELGWIVMTFQIPGGSAVSLRGQVRSRSKSSQAGYMVYGVEFTNVHFSHKRQIRSFVSSRLVDEEKVS